MRLLAAVAVALGVVAGVGVYFGVESFQGGETPKGGPEDLTPGPEFAQGSRDESDCIWATPPLGADTDELICARECPECFPELPPGPPEYEPCTNPDTSLELPDYESLEKPDTKDWQRYESPNYRWSFLYPPDWSLRVVEQTDLYGDVKGPFRELLKLWPPAMKDEVDILAPGAATLTISLGPRAVESFCPESPSVRKAKVDVSIAAQPALVEMVVQDIASDDPHALWKGINYSVTASARLDEHVLAHATLATQTEAYLPLMRTLVESMEWGHRSGG
jgi:hypothetical protein